MIALLCSVQAEAELLIARMTPTGTNKVGCKTITEGTLTGRQVALCVGGMGKVNAAHASTVLLTRYAPEAILLFGVGGAYRPSGAKIGEVAVATAEIAGDEGVLTVEGFKDTEYIGIPLLTVGTTALFNHYPAPAGLLEASRRSLSGISACTVHAGPFVTVSCCTGTAERARELEGRYHGICENMEGAAVAQVAACHGVPWIEVRGISNLVEDRDLANWDIPRAADAAQKAVLTILLAWGR